ncbi:MAG: Glu/Leu/Phe/Val dehydrogenase dimerization domain-containing protein [Gemmatimonadales bacterium]
MVVSYDQPTGTWIFVAIHNTTLGRALGGCRMRVYETAEDGLLDAMRLAEGMTYKWAAIGFEFGGGKSVLAIPGPIDPPVREGLLRRFGQLVESLRGAYSAGEDLGTTPEDMAIVAQETRWVKGLRADGARAVDPGPYTALGVFLGIRAAVRHVFGSDDLHGKTVLLQGVGDVGEPLARRLKNAGANIVVCDLNEPLARRVATELEGETVEPHLAYARTCDIYAPCSIGATLNKETIPQLHCRIVAGSANNQLASPEDAELLHQRGILYAPDYVVNAGGAIALPMLDGGEHTEDQVRDRIRQLEDVIGKIFDEASGRDESPVRAAQRLVDRVLEAKRRKGTGS